MRDWAEHWRRREELKAALRAAHDAALEEYLSGMPPSLPPGFETPDGLLHHENYIPIAIRRAALRSNHQLRKYQKRKHRWTGRRRGPHRDDAAVARHVYRLVQEYGLDPLEARRELAHVIEVAENITFRAALARVRRATRKIG